MRFCFKYFIYLFVFIGHSLSNASSYEDFFHAVDKDNSIVVADLLDRGFDPNTMNPRGQYAVLAALNASALKVVDVLLAHPTIDLDVRTPQDESPLMIASLKGFLPVCRALIKRDVDVNKPGWAPLHYAASGGHVPVIQLLLENNAYIDAESPNGTTPLMMAARYGSWSAVKALLDAGADINLKNQLGFTALDFAVNSNQKESADLIAAAVRAKKPKGTW
jgi:ankyrin repeat protein